MLPMPSRNSTIALESVHGLGEHGRIYARFHWDKHLQQAKIEISVKGGVATLTGTVPTAKAKAKAIELAEDTVGIDKVIAHLTVTAHAGAGQVLQVSAHCGPRACLRSGQVGQLPEPDIVIEAGRRQAGAVGREGYAAEPFARSVEAAESPPWLRQPTSTSAIPCSTHSRASSTAPRRKPSAVSKRLTGLTRDASAIRNGSSWRWRTTRWAPGISRRRADGWPKSGPRDPSGRSLARG